MSENYLDIKELRRIFREFTFSGGSRPAFKQSDYRKRIKIHFLTLKKYLDNFHHIYRMEKGRRYKKENPSIRDVYNLFIANRKTILKDFAYYLKYKTHFSYEIGKEPKPLKIRKKWTADRLIYKLKNRSVQNAYKGKLAEFIILILAEYIILHNYMWASGLKPRQVNSIDDFLFNILW